MMLNLKNLSDRKKTMGMFYKNNGVYKLETICARKMQRQVLYIVSVNKKAHE